MSALVAAPLLIPLATAALSLLAWRTARARAAMALAGAVALIATAAMLLVRVNRDGILTMQAGSWEAPTGISLVVDMLSALLLLLTGVMTLTVCIYSLGWRGPSTSPAFIPLIFVLVLGVNGAFLTGDLFNLYVWFEVLLVASFGLLILSGDRPGFEGAVKALVLNLVGSLLFLTAVGATYGLAGTLNLSDLHVRMGEIYEQRQAAVTAVAAMLTLAFSLKAALFPVFFWLPASYHVPAPGICALFSALLTKVGIYSLLRLFTVPFSPVAPLLPIVIAATAVTMVSGVLGAITQFEIKRILAWHSISQTGYIAAGIGLVLFPDPRVRLLAVTAVIFFLLHHALVKPVLFLIGGLVERRSGTTELKANGGLYPSHPLLSAAFLLAALSLAGIPPLSGFWAKLAVLRAAAAGGQWGLVAAALGAGLLTLLSMIKIWNEAFWKPRPGEDRGTDEPVAAGPPRGRAAAGASLWAPTLLLLILIAGLGVFPKPVLDLSRKAAASVLDPKAYVRAVGLDPDLSAGADGGEGDFAPIPSAGAPLTPEREDLP
jgi:multicomponent Na+:H+ antiporter subunit D